MQKIMDRRVVPAVTVEASDEALLLAEAMLAGGLDVMEITFRTRAAAAAMAAVSQRFPEMFVGAGTVLTVEQLDQAGESGAKFAVAPGLNPDVVRHAARCGLPFVPGVMTPGEVDLGVRMGLKLLKFFPADACGGAKGLKAVAAPFAHTGVKYMPTGGISAANAQEYLALPVVAAVGGSWMVNPALVKDRKWGELTRLCREAVELGASQRKA